MYAFAQPIGWLCVGHVPTDDSIYLVGETDIYLIIRVVKLESVSESAIVNHTNSLVLLTGQ